MSYRSLVFEFEFNPIIHLAADEAQELRALLAAQNRPEVFRLKALQRRMFWSFALPTGAFVGDFRPGFIPFSEDLDARDALIRRGSEEQGLRMPSRRAITLHTDGNTYYHQHLIDILRRVHPAPAFFNALHAFVRAAQSNPQLIKGPPPRKTLLVPPTSRQRVAGRLTRGIAWQPHEDLVLRQWFARRTTGPDAGKHVVLSDVEWSYVLDRLDGLRTKGSVLARITVLNQQLRRELTVDGYIPRQRYAEYFDRVLGEHPRGPKVAPQPRRTARPASAPT